jgi:Outer membrane protein beta-barrel domain
VPFLFNLIPIAMHRLTIFSCSLLLLCSSAHANENSESGITLAGDIQSFNYREHDNNGNLLDRENGYIPGLLLGMDRSFGPWQLAGQLAYHSGDVTYTGQTTGGVPITTTTNQQVMDAELRAGYRFAQIRQFEPALYFGAGRHEWQRNIHPTHTAGGTAVGGLQETYDWWQVFLGTRLSHKQTDAFTWGMDLRVAKIIAPEIKVDFLGVYDNMQLKLGERWGYRLEFPMAYAMNSSTTLMLSPYLEQFSFGRSASAPLTSHGVAVGTAHEPDSSSSHYGIWFGIHRSY